MTHLLDNLFWHSMSGPHVPFSLGTSSARRYAPGFSPMLGFAEQERPDLGAIRPFCEPGEKFFTDGWSGPVPADWNLDFESTMFKMIWDKDAPQRDEAPDAVQLDLGHATQALELAELTHPGPFGLRTLEMGDYFGLFEEGRLVAMAGERLWAGDLREISGVCTHPDFQGRGLARKLMLKLIRRQMERGQTPVLHVRCDNATAHGLYGRMGFADHKVSPVRVVSLA